MFITVTNLYGVKSTISLDNILSITPSLHSGCDITLKEIKKGNNVVIHCTESHAILTKLINRFGK